MGPPGLRSNSSVNQVQAPPYQHRQDMDVPDRMAGRAAYNAFAHWTGCTERKLLDRIDVLAPGGKERLRALRAKLEDATDRVVAGIPLWADLPTGRAFSRNASRGRKAFALAGQRIYLSGLSVEEVAAAGLPWELAVRAVGAAAARSSLVAELSGTTEIPDGCDLLGGILHGGTRGWTVAKQFCGSSPTPSPAGSDLLWSALKQDRAARSTTRRNDGRGPQGAAGGSAPGTRVLSSSGTAAGRPCSGVGRGRAFDVGTRPPPLRGQPSPHG